MNAHLAQLQPYPFEKLRTLFAGITPPANLPEIRLSIGEPQHAAPACVGAAMIEHLDGLSRYPQTLGEPALREAISAWLGRRYAIPAPDPQRQIIPVNGSREALFAFTQCMVNSQAGTPPAVLLPNPFYQIYEGAALLAGAQPLFYNQWAAHNFALDFAHLDAADWQRIQLLTVCSPGNPSGHVLTLEDWRMLFALADQHDFTLVADECYSEIYPEGAPPLGGLEAAVRLGRNNFRRLVVFSSLSKRSNVPGLRSGFVAGDAELLATFLRYRTYHGCAMSPPVQAASIAAWNDETHVAHNRKRYAEKFAAVLAALPATLAAQAPAAGFYLWPQTPGDDAEFARGLYQHYNVLVLPGSYLARIWRGGNPGSGRVRIALVPPLADCVEAARRIRDYCAGLPR